MKHLKTITVSKAATGLIDGLTGYLGDAFQQVTSLLKKQLGS